MIEQPPPNIINTLLDRQQEIKKKYLAASSMGMSHQVLSQLQSMLAEVEQSIHMEMEITSARAQQNDDKDDGDLIIG
jgi:hypothetical protein